MYSKGMADLICERLAQGESLNAICKDEGMPAESTVRTWVLTDSEGFAANYARAREIGYEHHADAIIDLADQSRVGVKRTTKGNGDVEEVEGDMVERCVCRSTPASGSWPRCCPSGSATSST